MRDYMDRRVSSPTWGPTPTCKQALSQGQYLVVIFSQLAVLFANLPNDVGWFQMANSFDVLFYGSIVISFANKNSKATYETHYSLP